MCDLGARSIAMALGLLLAAGTAPAQVTNGSFEDPADHLAGWTPGPDAGVEALQATHFSPNQITPPDGSWLVLVSTGPGDIDAPGGDYDANGTADHDGSLLSTSLTTIVAGERLSFSWAFLTDEMGPGGQGEPKYDDLFDITLDGISIVRGSVRKPGGSSPFTDTVAYDGLRYTVGSPGPTDGSDFGTNPLGGRTPFQQVCVEIADPGTHTLEILVADQADTTYDSGLLLDAIEVPSACEPTLQLTTSSESILEVKGGGLVFTTVTNGRAAMSDDGATLAFGSNGDYTGDNPNLQEQIWIANRKGAAFDISRLTAAVNAEFGRPTVSDNGQWLAFASTADLVPPGNADGNLEIFRYDVTGDGLTQITGTAGCANSAPTINDAGDAIAFVSDCNLGISAAGGEIVLWDGSFRGVDTSGCTSRDPLLSDAGRHVSFLTQCDGQYPGIANPDGSFEIVQWDSATDLYTRITDTPAGSLLDGLASNADGAFLSFASNADHEAGENPTGDFTLFRYDRTAGTFLQLAAASPLALFGVTSIDESGSYVAAERIDLVTGAFDVVMFDSTLVGTTFPVATGSATVSNLLPEIAVSNNRPLIAYQSDDTGGGNPDGNSELWLSGAVLDPPQVLTYCSTPNLAIPDKDNDGVSDVISVAAGGTLTDLDLYVEIDHTWVGDLRVDLRHLETGTARRMIDRPGKPPGAGCSGDDIDTTLDDEAAEPAEDVCVTPGPVAILGRFQPSRSLDKFDGEDLSGDWELNVSDRAGSNFGTLLEWCLIPSTP